MLLTGQQYQAPKLSEFNPLVRNFGVAVPTADLVHGMVWWVINVGAATATPYWYNATTATWVAISVPPSGAAGGDLNGFFPNPGVAQVGGATAAAIADAAAKRHSQNTDTGTTSSIYQLNSGASGVKLKDSSGLEIRNAADTADANLQANQVNASGGYMQLAGNNFVQGGPALPGSGAYNGQTWYLNNTTPGTWWVWNSATPAWVQFTDSTVTPAAKARVLNDTTARAAGYSNTAIQVTGVAGIPTFAKSIYVNVTFIGSATGYARLVLDNPDSPTGATAIAGYISASGNYIVQMSQVGLSSLGRISYTVLGSSVGYTQLIFDVTSYAF